MEEKNHLSQIKSLHITFSNKLKIAGTLTLKGNMVDLRHESKNGTEKNVKQNQVFLFLNLDEVTL